MTRTASRDIFPTRIMSEFRRVTKLGQLGWQAREALTGVVAYTYQPNGWRTNKFERAANGSMRLALDRFDLLVQRYQYNATRDNKLVLDAILAAYRFRRNLHTGGIFIDAQVDPLCACYAANLSLRDPKHPASCNPRQRISRIAAAVLMHRAALDQASRAEPPAAAPELPVFVYTFRQDSPPVPERSPAMHAAAAALDAKYHDMPLAELPDDVLRAAMDLHCQRDDQFVHAPSWLFARDLVDYPVHPRNGTTRPTVDAPEGADGGGWVMCDGRWIPLPQKPVEVTADLSRLLGRPSDAAWEALASAGKLPIGDYAVWGAATTDEEWAAIRAGLAADLVLDEQGQNPLAEAWTVLAGLDPANSWTHAEIVDGPRSPFADVRRPFVFEDEAQIGLFGIRGIPCAETMSYRELGLEVNLYDVHPSMSRWFEPLPPDDIARLRRGLELPPRRRHVHS